MKIAVFGAGAIGGHIAARLAARGADVSVIARGAQLTGIRNNGLTIQAPDGTFRVDIKATDDPSSLPAQDMVLVTVKAPALASVAAGIGALLGPATKVAFVMNGIPWWYLGAETVPGTDPDGAMRRAIGLDRVIGGVVHSSCTVVEPGVIVVANARSRLILGTPDDRRLAEITQFQGIFDQAAFACENPVRIRDLVWSKLLGNLATGPVSVLTGSAPKDAFVSETIQAATRSIFAEACAVATAEGCSPVIDVEATIAALAKMVHRPSILQDLERGRPMEIDGIFSATQFLARRAGVATPTIDLLVALTKIRARAAGLYDGNAV